MMSLLRAELRKQWSLSFGRSLVLLLIGTGAAIVIAMAGLDVSGVVRTRFFLGWPATISFWANFVGGLLAFVPAALAAWGIGLEQSHDTWKMVLTRRSPRRAVLLTKALTTLIWVGGFMFVTFVLWVGLGSLADALMPADKDPILVPLDIRGDAFQLLASTLKAIAVVPLTMLVALVARSNATLTGTLVGIIGPFAIHLTELWQWVALNRLTPMSNAAVIVAHLSNNEKMLKDTAELVGPEWGAAPSAFVLSMWVLVPLAVAIWHFERKDIISEVA